MISIVVRPFKSGGVFYPAGTIIEPAGFKLYKSRLGEGKIREVAEHDLENVAEYLQIRHGVENALETFKTHIDGIAEEEATKAAYIAKVQKAATQYGIDTEGKSIEEVVVEVKAKATASKTE